MKFANNGELVIFKSVPYFFRKEKSGAKSNTVRKLNVSESAVFKRLGSRLKSIRIVNKDSGKWFQREISDISYFGPWVVISWRSDSQ